MQPAPLPGLAAQGIDPSTGAPVGDYIVGRVPLSLQLYGISLFILVVGRRLRLIFRVPHQIWPSHEWCKPTLDRHMEDCSGLVD